MGQQGDGRRGSRWPGGPGGVARLGRLRCPGQPSAAGGADLLVQCGGRGGDRAPTTARTCRRTSPPSWPRRGASSNRSRILLAGGGGPARAAEMVGHGGCWCWGMGAMRAAPMLAARPESGPRRRRPRVVLVARHPLQPTPGWRLAANSLKAGARLVIANPDLTHPGPQGRLTPGDRGPAGGSDRVALPTAADGGDRQARAAPVQAGGRDRWARSPRRTVMIGDNPATDIAGAARLRACRVVDRPGRAGLDLRDLSPSRRQCRSTRPSRSPGQNRLIDRVSKVDCRVRVARS